MRLRVTASGTAPGTVTAMVIPSMPEPMYDLRTFFRTVGHPTFGAALNAEPPERKDSASEVEMIETERVKVTARPLDAQAFIDGVQSSLVVTHREHRPVYLTYQAAGAVGAHAKLIGLRERLTLVCSVADRAWVDEVNAGERPIPVDELAVLSPPDVEKAAYAQLGDWRERLERQLVEDLSDAGVGPLVVDGSLLGRPYDLALHAVVKDVLHTRYLADERILYGLPEGWRSPIFKLAAGGSGRYGCPFDRFSCYLRLHDARAHAWSFGLIRLEAFDPAALDALAARAMTERQSPRSGDGRWDRHLSSVAVTEKTLRSRRPKVFDFSS